MTRKKGKREKGPNKNNLNQVKPPSRLSAQCARRSLFLFVNNSFLSSFLPQVQIKDAKTLYLTCLASHSHSLIDSYAYALLLLSQVIIS